MIRTLVSVALGIGLGVLGTVLYIRRAYKDIQW